MVSVAVTRCQTSLLVLAFLADDSALAVWEPALLESQQMLQLLSMLTQLLALVPVAAVLWPAGLLTLTQVGSLSCVVLSPSWHGATDQKPEESACSAELAHHPPLQVMALQESLLLFVMNL